MGNAFGHRLSVNGHVSGGELMLEWSYDGLRYEGGGR